MSRPDPRPVVDAVAATRARIVLIDGPSGAGKSDLADRLIAMWPPATRPVLVRMDDIYPGWHGLEAGSDQVTEFLIEPLCAGRDGRWQSYDWNAERPGQWHEVPAGTPVVVEGCGCLTARSAGCADVSVWLDADDDIRKARALARDRGAFDAYWDLWQAQFEAFVAREHPAGRATIRLDGT